MAALGIRYVPDEVHRAIRVRAAQKGHTVEIELRDILEAAVRPQGRVMLGSLLAEIGREVRLTNDEFTLFTGARGRAPARAANSE